MSMRRASWIAVLAIVSCATARAPDSVRSSPGPGMVSADAGAQSPNPGAEGDAGTLALYAARFRRESDDLGEPLRLYIAHDQTAPRGFVDLRKRKRVPRLLRRARMFAFNFADVPYGDCGEQTVFPDGILCPAATYPGEPLSDEETQKAAEILCSAPSSWSRRPDVRCFEPHHSVVFFDEHDVPVAEISVCFECGNMKLLPGPSREAGMTDGEGTLFADLCRAHGVGACPPPGAKRIPDLPLQSRPTDEGRQALTIHRALSRKIDVPTERRIDQLSKRDRKLFIAWLASVTAAAPGLQCNDGRLIVSTEGADWDKHPRCNATVGEIEGCTRSRLEPVCGPDAPECAQSDLCQWGTFAKKHR